MKLCKRALEARNDIFLNFGVPSLQKNGFRRSPFSTDSFGKDDLGGYDYVLCRFNHSALVIIECHIINGENWIQIYLNVFHLIPPIESSDQLVGLGATNYHLPPNSATQMRLRSDDVKGLYLFHVLFGKKHKLGKYSSEAGLKREAEKLGKLIEADMNNIDYFVKRWYEIHTTPNKVLWDGTPVNSSQQY